MQWQSPRNNDAFDITSLHHAVPLTTSLVSSTFSAEPTGPEQHRHCRSEHNKKITISWNQRNRFRCISLWDRICETHQNEYAWISLPWVIVVIVILPTESPVFFQEVSMSMYRGWRLLTRHEGHDAIRSLLAFEKLHGKLLLRKLLVILVAMVATVYDPTNISLSWCVFLPRKHGLLLVVSHLPRISKVCKKFRKHKYEPHFLLMEFI